MMKSTQGTNCVICSTREAVVLCNGCEKALCSHCRTFDIWNHGCGSGDVKAFCSTCNNDPDINIYRQPTKNQ